VLVRQLEAVAMAGPHALERRILMWSTALGLVLAALAALLARRRLTRPMDDLSGAIERVAQATGHGAQAAELPVVEGFHEAKVLSQAMRQLVRSEGEHRRALQSMNAQLEDTVAARTAELRTLLMRDVLTGLPNRRALMEALPEAMQRARRIGKPCAIMFLDMDGFKGINDTYGHEEGDELLRQFGARIAEGVRTTDTVARLAGDEFVVILEMLADAGDAEEKARSLLPALQRPFTLKKATVTLSASIGIAVHMPDDAQDLDALLARADRAMYAAKREGKNRVALENA
jgi:diguanylate cyclase (GGDEF)-like protein